MQVQFYDSDLNKGSIRFHRTWFDFIILYTGFFQYNQQWFCVWTVYMLSEDFKEISWILGGCWNDSFAFLYFLTRNMQGIECKNPSGFLQFAFSLLVKQMFTYLDYLCIISIWHVFRTGKRQGLWEGKILCTDIPYI